MASVLSSVCLSVCLSVHLFPLLSFEPTDLLTSIFVCVRSLLPDSGIETQNHRLRLRVRVTLGVIGVKMFGIRKLKSLMCSVVCLIEI